MKNLFRVITLIYKSFLFLILFSNTYSQTSIDTVWTKTFPGIYSDVARQVKQTSDGGFIITGESESFGPGIWAAYVIKTDSLGETEWNKTYGGAAFDFPYGIVQTSDEGYVIATYTTSYGPPGTNLRIIRLDAEGDTLWTSVLPNTNQHLVNSAGCILQTEDNGYIIAAYGWKPPKANQVVVIKTDSLGIPEWTKDFGGSVDDFGGTIQKTSDGNYIVSGYTYSYGSGACDGYIIKINSTGDSLWTKVYGASSFDSFRFIQITSDGGYIAAGTTQSYGSGEQAWVVKTDSAGNEQWSKAIGGSENEAFEGAAETVNGEYFLSGSTNSFGSGGHDAFFVRLDKQGNIIQQKAIGSAGEDFGATIEQTSDNGFVACGTYEGNYLDIWLLRFTSDSVLTGLTDEQVITTPSEFTLFQNYPNPFNPETNLKFSIPEESYVELNIYNSLGEEVYSIIKQELAAGTYTFTYSPRNMNSGVYFCRLKAGIYAQIMKMVYIK